MSGILVHLTHGSDRPTEADRAFLIAEVTLEEGHRVSLFLAGAAAELVTEDALARPLGFGPVLRERIDRIIGGGGEIHVSKMSCELRGIDPARLHQSARLSTPNELVRLSLANDRVITYG